MARDSIIQKLVGELHLPLQRESEVLYIMAEIRKIVEHEREHGPPAYEVLQLFCNWVLHITISRKSNADRLKLFFAAFDMKQGMSLEEWFQSKFFNRMMQLAVLRRELEQFFADHELPCEPIREHRYWSAFIYLYTSIAAEVTLQYTQGDLLPDEVQSVTITRIPQEATGQMMTRWLVRLRNGKEFSGATLYGQYRDAAGRLTGLPDFFDGHFQL